MIDPVCIFHGKKRSEHLCLYCCICFKTLEIEDCHELPDGTKENVCNECVELEKAAIQQIKDRNADHKHPAP